MTKDQKEKLIISKDMLNKTIDAVIENLDMLKQSKPSVYKKFNYPINLIIETAYNSIDQLTENILDSLEGLAKLINTFLERSNDDSTSTKH